MSAAAVAKRLSHEQRELLIEHIVSPQPIDYRPGSGAANARRTMRALIGHGLIIKEMAHCKKNSTYTLITELGREAAAVVLAFYADALVRAGKADEIKALGLTPKELAERRLLVLSATALTEK